MQTVIDQIKSEYIKEKENLIKWITITDFTRKRNSIIVLKGKTGNGKSKLLKEVEEYMNEVFSSLEENEPQEEDSKIIKHKAIYLKATHPDDKEKITDLINNKEIENCVILIDDAGYIDLSIELIEKFTNKSTLILAKGLLREELSTNLLSNTNIMRKNPFIIKIESPTPEEIEEIIIQYYQLRQTSEYFRERITEELIDLNTKYGLSRRNIFSFLKAIDYIIEVSVATEEMDSWAYQEIDVQLDGWIINLAKEISIPQYLNSEAYNTFYDMIKKQEKEKEKNIKKF
jgi:energy-coupling factor transporter ATP-binding protein EcfA2